MIFFIYLRKTMISYKTDYYLYTALVVKSPSFLEEKFFTRCELQGTGCKFLEKRRKDEIAALSSKVHKDRGGGFSLEFTLTKVGAGRQKKKKSVFLSFFKFFYPKGI